MELPVGNSHTPLPGGLRLWVWGRGAPRTPGWVASHAQYAPAGQGMQALGLLSVANKPSIDRNLENQPSPCSWGGTHRNARDIFLFCPWLGDKGS